LKMLEEGKKKNFENFSRTHIFVSGKVQGVFFRYNTQRQARKLGLVGWVWNLPDGRVEAVFEGEKARIEKIIEWIKQSPGFSRVEKVEVKWETPTNEFKDFRIIY